MGSEGTETGWGRTYAGLLAFWIAFGAIPAVPTSATPQEGTVPEPATRATRSSEPPSRHHPSAYLPIKHWAYPILDYWVSRGRVGGLSPLVKPYRRMDVARAVVSVGAEPSHAFEAVWLARLRRELAPELRALTGEGSGPEHLALRISAGATLATQTHRDPLRPELDGRFSADRLLERLYIDAHGQGGVLAAGLRFGRDGIFLDDAQFPDGRVIDESDAPLLDELGARVEEGYVEFQTKYASLFFGRMYRNWGLPRLPGFVRSDYAYSEEEIGYRFGTDRVFLIGSFAPFNDFRSDTTRYFSTHRLEVRPWNNFVFALTESVIHGGPSQPLAFKFINPIGFWHIEGERASAKNTVGQVDLWWRPLPGLAVYGSLLVDATNSNDSCCQMGGSIGLDLSNIVPGWIIRARGTAIQSLAYRTERPWEEYSIERIGLGWDKVDMYLATLEADWFTPGGLLLRPRIDLQVRGEGDFRGLRPPAEELPSVERILVGQAETTVRPAIAGWWRPGPVPWLDVRWDLGLNVISGYGNEGGIDRTEFVGQVQVTIETPRWLMPLGG